MLCIRSVVQILRKKNTPLFKCIGYCKFKDCLIKCTWKWFPKKYDFNDDQHARSIIFIQQSLKESIKDGTKPFEHFTNEFQKKDKGQIISGIGNNRGKDKVFRQISSESRQIGRKDEDVRQSLLKTMKAVKELRFGLIEKIAASPCTEQYQSDENLRLYLYIGKDILFGNVVRRGSG